MISVLETGEIDCISGGSDVIQEVIRELDAEASYPSFLTTVVATVGGAGIGLTVAMGIYDFCGCRTKVNCRSGYNIEFKDLDIRPRKIITTISVVGGAIFGCISAFYA